MKKVLIVNGGPRKNFNTATLLAKAAEGAKAAGAEVETVHLYDLTYRGCISCFGCKRKDGKYNGKCIVFDDLTIVLKKAMASDVVIMGSPIYLADVTGMMRSFMERLIFSNLSYDHTGSNMEGKIDVGFIYTMNLNEADSRQRGYMDMFEQHSSYKRAFNGEWEWMAAYDTLQFDDYSKYAASRFDPVAKEEWKEKQFPVDCENAFMMGKRLASDK